MQRKVFLSFSSRDNAVARRLFSSLKSQGIDLWDYTRRGDEIPWGANIPEVLARQIETSEFIIVIVSAHSVDASIGRYTHLEVKFALEQHEHSPEKILPLVLANAQPREWLGAFAMLETRRYFELHPDDPQQYEETIARICRALGVRYLSPFLGDARLPVLRRFEEEVRNVEVGIAPYVDVSAIINRLAQALAQHDWTEAERLTSFVLLTCAYNAPSLTLYYPLIIKGVCDLQLGRFAEAEETFLEAIKHPHCDANSFAGLGQVFFRTKRYEEALESYQRALPFCSAEEARDVQCNIIGTRMQLGLRIDDASALDQLAPDEMPSTDRLNILNLKLLVLYQWGRFEAALDLFDSMKKQQRYDATTVAYVSMMFMERGRQQEAFALLRSESDFLEDVNLYHRLADVLLRVGEVQQAISVYERHLCLNVHRTRQYMIEYARILKATGKTQEAQRVCHALLDRKNFRNPITPEDFYYDGFANYVLGFHERARYDFERSKGFFDRYYSDLEL